MIESKIAGYPIILPEFRHAFHSERPDWHKAWLDSIHESLKPDDVVIDVGAEQGDLSALIACWLPDGGVFLAEPVVAFWPTIRVIFEANYLLPPLGAFIGFISDETAYPLGLHTDWPAESSAQPINDPGFQHLNERPDLPRLRLDDWGVEPTAILIDVEGAELHVLRGAEELLERHPLVWCAIHPEIMQQRYGDTPNELLRFMKGLGYGWEFLDFAGELHFKFSPR